MVNQFTGVRYTEAEMVEMLTALIECEGQTINTDLGNARIDTFDQAGLLTRNKGIVLTIGDQEFQIEVLRSR